jgi:hypothetical protein
MIRRVPRQTAFGLVLVGLSLAWAAPARADDANRIPASGGPDALIDQGLELREHGKDAEALALFQQAFRESPSPRAKAQIALAEQALGRWALAEKDLTAALASADDPWIAKYKDALDGALVTVRTHLGDLILNGGVAGADVLVDGVKTAVLPPPGPLRLVVGTHTLEVRADGYYPFSQPVTIRADAPAAVSVEMHVRAAAAAPKSDAALAPPPPSLRPPEPRAHPQRTVGVVIAVSAAAPLALGFVGLGLRASEVSAYNADATCPGLSSPTQPAGCQSHIDAAGTWQAVTIAGFVAAGVLAVTGLVVALTAPRGVRATLALAPSGVTWTARW